MARFTFQELVEITGGKVLASSSTSGMFTLCTDSRKITSNDIYIPIKGENFNGEDFIENAVCAGARGFLTTSKNQHLTGAKFAILVDDAKTAYLKLASYYKNKVSPITIAITGSSGKTTTKEIMSAVLSTSFRTHKSLLNHNNEIGLAQTLLSMPKDCEILITEMGMRGLKEIDLLAKYAQPDIAIVTNIGTAHIGILKTRNNIAQAKCEVANHLHAEGAFIAFEDELLEKYLKFKGRKILLEKQPKNFAVIENTQNSAVFRYKGTTYKLNIGGEYNIENAMLVIEAAMLLGLQSNKINAGLQSYTPIEKRFEEIKIKDINIINDSYNANPDSVKAAVKAFLDIYNGKKYVILGDMGELGENEIKYHGEIGEFLNSFEEVEVITVGRLSKNISDKTKHPSKHFSSNIEVAKYISEHVQPNSHVLLKASRAMKLEEIIKELEKL